MLAWTAVLAALVASPPGPGAPAGALLAEVDAAALPLARLTALAEPARAPTFSLLSCSGDVCQPVVAVPGFEPGYSMRGKPAELALRFTERLRVGPVATLAHWLVVTGLRLDWTPPQLAPGRYPPGYSGFGYLGIEMRWRIDALGAPDLEERP